MKSHHVLRPIALLLAGGMATAPLFSQPASSPFAEVIDVRVVNVEVVVTEKGDRVRGLGPGDFLLKVDGKEVPIEYFTEVEGGIAVERNMVATDETVPALAPGAEVGTSYLVFIDDFFARTNDRNRVIDGLIEQLPNLTPNDRMAVVAFDGKSIDMLETWSQSLPSLTDAFRKAKMRDTFGLQREAERRVFSINSDLGVARPNRDTFRESSFTTGQSRVFIAESEQYARRLADQVDRASKAAASALRSFASPPGRKVMMLLSGGWPSEPAYWVTTDSLTAVQLSGIKGPNQLMAPLAETANRLGYTIYAVDVPGLSGSRVDASIGDVETARSQLEETDLRERDEERMLVGLAERTGGEALLNGNNVRAFERAVADTRSYYWLGFTPKWVGDNAKHKITVDVRRKGLDIRTREGFSDLSRSTEVSMMVESSLLFGDPPSVEPLKVEIGRGKKAGFGTRDVPIKVQVPLGPLAFLPTAGGFAADTEMRVAVLDEDGNTSDIPVMSLLLKTPTMPAANSFTVWEHTLRMRNKKHQLVVSLYDKASGKILSAKVDVPAK